MLNNVCVLTVKVNNMRDALPFYTDILDFKVSKTYSDKIVSLVHESIPIVLEESSPTEKVSANQVLLGINSEDIEVDFKKLKERGANLLFNEPEPCPPGRYFIIEDPSGNQIEIVEFSNQDQ
ncbi:MAG: VOC family protein [Anaerobacillus sp.]